ncbi:peptidase A2 domain-containing protein [Trichonephila clavipes]|nr:peptidase A2 domain-containing protein [Trichonephila clavipes]
MLGNEIVSALIHTVSTVSPIRENLSTNIVELSRLSKINTVLYGLGPTEVITKGSFEYDFVLDKDQYSLMWHDVPTKQLNFEAIIDVIRRIILNDDIPVYQQARRLSYAEKKSVNNHIEERFEQEIVRPRSSENTSPIVLVKKKKTYYKKRKQAPKY